MVSHSAHFPFVGLCVSPHILQEEASLMAEQDSLEYLSIEECGQEPCCCPVRGHIVAMFLQQDS